MDVLFKYEPINDKIREFHASPARDRCITGGFGSGKTHCTVAEAIMLAMEFPNNEIDVCRKTFGELDRSTRPTFQDLLPKEIISKPYSTADHRIELVNSSYIQFFPLDDPEKVKSLNAGVILIDEASEIPEKMFLMLRGRLRRPVPRRCMLLSSNPTLTNHWLYKWFGSPDKPADRFHRSLSSYENPYLPQDYLMDLERSMPEDLYRIYVMGEWGYVSFGERVYAEFGLSLHTGEYQYNPDLPVLRGWDFGYRFPAVVFVQIDKEGRIRVLGELMRQNRLIEYFAEDVIEYGNRYFPGAKYEDYGDPAGDHKDARGVTERTAMDVLREKYGINIHCRSTPIKEGINLIRRKLSLIVSGQPAMGFHKERCPILVEGMAGGYVCKVNKDGTILRDEPKEDGYFEHLQDALRMVMVNKFAYDLKRLDQVRRSLPAYKPAFEGTAW